MKLGKAIRRLWPENAKVQGQVIGQFKMLPEGDLFAFEPRKDTKTRLCKGVFVVSFPDTGVAGN